MNTTANKVNTTETMNATGTTESRVKCYGDREMTLKGSELKDAGYTRTANAYWVEHWQKGNELVILERCDESERPTTTEPTTNTPTTMNANETIANTPANLAKLHALAVNGSPMFYVWLDAVDDAATTSVYLTEDAARADIARLEADDKETGIYEPDAYRIINAAPYFA